MCAPPCRQTAPTWAIPRTQSCAEVEDLDGELDGDDGVLLAGVDKGDVTRPALVFPDTGADLAVLVEVVGGLLVCHHLDDLAGGAVRDLFAAFHLDLEGGGRQRVLPPPQEQAAETKSQNR